MGTMKGQGGKLKKESGRDQHKKPYSPPKLMEYGPVEKLTQAGSGQGQEVGTARRKQ